MNQNFDAQKFKDTLLEIDGAAYNAESVLGDYINMAKEMQDCLGEVDGGIIYREWVNIQHTTEAILRKYEERVVVFSNYLRTYVDNVLASNLSYYTELQSSSEKLNNINSRLGSL